jgi:hypothetical protein
MMALVGVKQHPCHRTAVGCGLASLVGISVRSLHKRTSGRLGGVKSRRSPWGALRADLSGRVVPRAVIRGDP